MMRFKYLHFFWTCFCLLLITTSAYAQKLTIISSSQKSPIPHVRIDVTLEEDTQHFFTNIDGEWDVPLKYSLKKIDLYLEVTGYKSLMLPQFILHSDTTILLTPTVHYFDEVAVTAQYKTRLVKDAVHNIKIIDRQQLETMAAQNVKEALENELNMHLSTDNILGSSLQIQGIGGENIKILVDGVPLTGRLNGNIDLSQIPIQNIQRIEVVEGPLSVSYGTDALAGTINIITKKSQNQRFIASTNNYFESSGKMNNEISLGWRLKKHQMRVYGGRHFFDGWNPTQPTFYFEPPIADSTRVQLWNPKIQWFGGWGYRFKGENVLLDYTGRLMHEKVINRGMPRPPLQIAAFDDYYRTMRVGQRLNFQYSLKNDYRVSLTGGYSGYFRRKNTFVRDLTTITDVLSGNQFDHDTSQYHSFIARGRFIRAAIDQKINFEVGFDFTYEIAEGKKITDLREDVGDYALYATAEYTPIKQITIRPGLRYSYNTNYNAPLTPSLNIRYAIFDKGNQGNLTLRASYARGFRSPSIKELFYTFVDANHDIVGNPELKAETSNNFNVSLHYNTTFDKIVWRNKLALFYNDIRNQITLAQITLNEYSYFNLNQYVTTGFQIESSVSYKRLRIGVGLGYIGRYNKIATGKDFTIDKFLFSPNLNFQVQYTWEHPGLQFALYYKYSGVLPQVIRDENGKYSLETLEDYQLADLKISKYLWGKRLQISVGVKNIFNVVAVEGSEGDVISAHSSGAGVVSVGMGRTYNVGIKLTIQSK